MLVSKKGSDSGMKKIGEKIIRMCDQELLDDPPILLFDTMYARPEKSTRLLSQNRLGLKRNQGRLEAMKKKLAEDCIKA